MEWEGAGGSFDRRLRLLAPSSRVRSRARWQHVLRIGVGGWGERRRRRTQSRAGPRLSRPFFPPRPRPPPRLGTVRGAEPIGGWRLPESPSCLEKGRPLLKAFAAPPPRERREREGRGGGKVAGAGDRGSLPFPLLSWFSFCFQFERSACSSDAWQGYLPKKKPTHTHTQRKPEE